MSGLRRARFALGLLVALLAVLARPAAAQDLTCDPGDIEVSRLDFTGNRAFSDAELANGIVTTPSSWTRRTIRLFGARRCLDPIELRSDSLRLIVFYRKHGYSQVAVGTDIRRRGPSKIDITFRIREGTPMLVERFAITGLDSVPDRGRIMRGLAIEEGGPFDQYAIEAARDTLARRLRNNGYPNAIVLRSFESDTVRRVASVSFDVGTGPRAFLGEIRLRIDSQPNGNQDLSRSSVRRVMGLSSGDLYRERRLEAAKRNLYLTDAFRHVAISPDSTSLGAEGDSTIDIDVTVAESFLRSARALVGWGTLDCFRTSGEYADLNFLGGLRRLDFNARISKIGIGEPLGNARALCSGELRKDPFSDTLNYYAAATIRQSTLFGLAAIPTLTIYSERRSEFQAFLRTTPIGAVTTVSAQRRRTLSLTAAYRLEYGRTEAEPALFCGLFNVCDPADRQALRDSKRLAVASWAITQNRADDLFNPTNGSVARLELRHASRYTGSERDLQFSKGVADAAWYLSVGNGNVLVARVQAGGVIGHGSTAATSSFIPPQERLYAGGPNTVRGFRQNELGPAIYVADTMLVVPGNGDTVYFQPVANSQRIRAVPTGGNSVVVGNLELRLRSPVLPALVQWVLFADAGQVWNRGGGQTRSNFQAIRVTPGAGVRVFSPVGPIRFDIGYNNYDRPPGVAYLNLVSRYGQNSPLYCISPGGSGSTPLAVTGYRPDDPDAPPPVQVAGQCEATYVPPEKRGLFRNVTLSFSIGQAF